MHVVAVPSATALGQVLQLELELGERDRVDQLAQVLGAEELAQELPIERERGGAPLGHRCVRRVHVDRDPAEQQGLRERGRPRGVDRDDVDPSGPDATEHLPQPGHVEHVAKDLARSLEQDRERWVTRGDLEQVRAALPLLPQRRPSPRRLAGEQERPCGRLPEHRREQRGPGEAGDHELLDLVGVEQEVLDRDPLLGLGQADRDAVVAPQHLDVESVAFGQPALDRHRPRRVHPLAERRQHAHTPVADLVGEPFDHDRSVVGDRAGCLSLVVEVRREVLGGELVQSELDPQAPDGGVVLRRRELAGHGADRAPEFERPPRLVAVPEGHLARLARRRRDHDAVERDVLDPPRRRAEHEHLAAPALVHHLLVELAHAATVDGEHAEEPSVGDRPAGGDRQPAGALAPPQRVRPPVPDDPGPELGELVGGVATRQQVEDVAEQVVREVLEVRRTPQYAAEIPDVPLVHRAHRDDLLRDHVERVPRVVRLLDRPLQHPLHDDRRLEQVASVLGEYLAAARFAHPMAGATDPLEAARDRARRLHLDHEIDRAHIDPELERARRDDRLQSPALELVLDLQPLLARDRAVMGPGELLAGELVQAGGEPLCQPSGVHEHDRRPVGPDQLEHLGMDRRPDRRLGRRGARRRGPEHGWHPLRRLRDIREVRHVLDRHDDLDLHRLAEPGVHDRHGTGAARGLSAQETRDLLERTLGRGQADPLWRLMRDLLEAFEGKREVCAALGAGHRVDLVDDDPADAPQKLAGLRREHQVERLGGRDQHVGRPRLDATAFGGCGVAGAHRDAWLVHVLAEALRRQADADQRRPQVLLDVDRERSQRRDIQDAASAIGGRGRIRHHAVERPQERRQRLARARRREDQAVPTAGDRGPPLRLRRGGRLERALEPRSDGGGEPLQAHRPTVPRTHDTAPGRAGLRR